MNTNLSQNEIDRLEKVLSDFKTEWTELQAKRAKKWRLHFLLLFILTFLLSLKNPFFWWFCIAVVSYFAGSLFVMLKQRAKTSQQILEHQKQLRLVRLLRKFQSSPYPKD